MLLPADSSPQSHLWSLIHLLLMVCGTGWLGAARRRWGSHKWRHTFKIPFSLSYCKKKEEKVGVALHESFFFLIYTHWFSLLLPTSFSPSHSLSFSLPLSVHPDCSFPPVLSIHSLTFFSLSHPFLLFLFRKGQSSLGYQPSMANQVALRLGTLPHTEAGRGKLVRVNGSSSREKGQRLPQLQQLGIPEK